jgi:hypothetical protein
METTQQLLSLIDDNKEKLSDGVYKEICDKLAELNKEKESKYVRIEGILLTMYMADDNMMTSDERVSLLVKVDDSVNRGMVYEIEMGFICTQYFKNINEAIKRHGYIKVMYNNQTDTWLIILKCETLKDI